MEIASLPHACPTGGYLPQQGSQVDPQGTEGPVGYRAVLCCALYHTLQRDKKAFCSSSILLCSTALLCSTICSAIQYRTIPYYIPLYPTLPDHTRPYQTIPYHTLYSTLLYFSLINPLPSFFLFSPPSISPPLHPPSSSSLPYVRLCSTFCEPLPPQYSRRSPFASLFRILPLVPFASHPSSHCD